MNKYLLFLLLFIPVAACTDKNATFNAQVNESVGTDNQDLSLTDLKDRFKFANLKVFEIDTLSYGTRPVNYQMLDEKYFNKVWQEKKHSFAEQDFVAEYFHSWQERNPDLIEFTILTEDESSNCTLLNYCIFDSAGKAVDKFVIAARCGDGGWVYDSYGKEISDDTLEVVSVETESELMASGGISEIVEGDSIVTHFTIGKDGKVTKKEISKTLIRREIKN
ncbi:hypothetical protein ACMA1I_06175 [Pontibacter sp. 13R65]|uniref:hypothetical protein n=1 Tax=Pontibacter sp. 13R65 TaxID=3127458 RepID=UPI00301DFA5E